MSTLERVYYFPLGTELAEEDPIVIDLKSDGSADLSRLPQDVRSDLEQGVASRSIGSVGNRRYPRDGQAFLRALLSRSGPYERYRETPDKLKETRPQV
jgi:hypothetical protein